MMLWLDFINMVSIKTWLMSNLGQGGLHHLKLFHCRRKLQLTSDVQSLGGVKLAKLVTSLKLTIDTNVVAWASKYIESNYQPSASLSYHYVSVIT